MAGGITETSAALVEQGRADARLASGDDLRGRAARGTIVNAAFLIGLNLLGFVKGFAVAAFLTASDYGVWGLLVVSLATLLVLVQVGVDDKYIQQDAADQKLAFQQAFTLQCLLCGLLLVLIVVAMPIYALAYDDWSIVAPGYVLALAMPAQALQSPLWTHYRRMNFLQQRKLQAFDPIVGFVVTIALAAAGLGYWSLVIGVVCGAWAAAIAALRASPYPLAFRYEHATLREYASFSGPLFLSSAGGVLIGLVPALIAQRTVGLAGVGAIAIASTISTYANRVDDIVTNTLYPAVCAVKDRAELLREAFMKSNRLALLWAMPTGVAIVLFAPDLVDRVLGPSWQRATFVIQAFGLTAAINQIGFNWSAFYRAIGRTRPIAVGTTVMFLGTMAFAVPLLLTDGIDGYGVGMGIAVLGYVAVRVHYLGRLFGTGAVIANSARGIAPVLPAVAAALAVRVALGGGVRTTADIVAEVVVFTVVAIAVTLFSERELLREFRGYLRRGKAAPDLEGSPAPA